MDRRALTAAIFRRGQKRELFEDGQDDDVEEDQECKHKLQEIHGVWATERCSKDLSVAVWRPRLHLAEVILQRGKVFAHMGIQRGRQLFLTVEEAVYLVDRGNLIVVLERGVGRAAKQVPLSLQEAHALLAREGCPEDHYLVFCKLLRAGYLVQRYPSRWIVSAGESLAGESGNWLGKKIEDGDAARMQWDESLEAGSLACQASQAGTAQADGHPFASSSECFPAPSPLPFEPPFAIPFADLPDLVDPSPSASPPPALPAIRPPTPPLASTPWWPLSPWIASIPAWWGSVPRAALLPKGLSEARQVFLRLGALPPFSPPPPPAPGQPHLSHFDVWEADSQFGRRSAGLPAFRLTVVPSNTQPTLALLRAVAQASAPVPVKVAMVEKGDISFYAIEHVALATLYK